MADEITETPQPEGQEGGADVPYREYLDRIPEQYRGEVQPVLDDWNKQVNGRFEQHADFRKTWEPYEQAGIRDASPEDLQQLLHFGQLLQNDPQAIAQWYTTQYAPQHGLTVEQQQQADEYGQEPYAEPDINQLLEQQLAPLQQQLQGITQWREQQEFQARTDAAMQFIEGQLSELEAKHGDQFNRDWVARLIPNHIETDPQNAVARAFADYQQLVGSVEQQLIASKLNQPQPAEAGGSASTQAEQPRNIKDANAQALAQLRGINST